MDDGDDRRLRTAAWLFAGGSLIHVVDHLRRGQGSVTEVLYVLGNVALVLQIVTIMLVLTRHRLAPLVAVVVGFQLAIGFTAAHWLPHWSAISDPVWKIGSLRWFSYVASIAEIVGALALAATALTIVRRRGLSSFAATIGSDGAGPLGFR